MKPTIKQHGCGVLLRDDFDSGRWGADFRAWVQDEALEVYVKDGELCVTGTSGKPVPVCAKHHEFRFTGLVSKNFVERNVVLASRMRVLAPLPKGRTRARYIVHLCGAHPDYFLDAAVCHEPDGREGWFFNALTEGVVSHDFTGPFIGTREIDPGLEHTVVVDYDSSSKVSRGFVVDGDSWTPLGQRKLFLSTVQAELKVDVPYDGVPVDVAFDDVRVYRRPETAPVRFVVTKPPFPFFAFAGVAVEFLDARGRAVGEPATTDAYGEALISLPGDRLYPIGGTVRLTYRGKEIGIARITASGVSGLYPGDVWVVTAPEEYRFRGKTYPLGY